MEVSSIKKIKPNKMTFFRRELYLYNEKLIQKQSQTVIAQSAWGSNSTAVLKCRGDDNDDDPYSPVERFQVDISHPSKTCPYIGGHGLHMDI